MSHCRITYSSQASCSALQIADLVHRINHIGITSIIFLFAVMLVLETMW